MSDDLIKRLLANGLDECDEAADRIEALQAENARLREALEWIGHGASRSMFVDDRHMLAAICAHARATLAKSTDSADMTRPGDVTHET